MNEYEKYIRECIDGKIPVQYEYATALYENAKKQEINEVGRLTPMWRNFLDIQRHLMMLSEESRYSRFCRPMDSEAIIAYVHKLEQDVKEGQAYIFGAFSNDGMLVGFCEVRLLHRFDRNGEIAISVLDKFQTRGTGQRLFNEMVHFCEAIGIKKLCTLCKWRNMSMRKLAQKAGMTITVEDGDAYATKIVQQEVDKQS